MWSMTISFTKRDGSKAKNPFGTFYASEEAKAARMGHVVNVFKRENSPDRDLVVFLKKEGEKDQSVNVGTLTPVAQTEANKAKIADGKSPYAKGTLDFSKIGGPAVGPIVAWYKKGGNGAFLSISPDKPRPTEATTQSAPVAAPAPVVETADIPF